MTASDASFRSFAILFFEVDADAASVYLQSAAAFAKMFVFSHSRQPFALLLCHRRPLAFI